MDKKRITIFIIALALLAGFIILGFRTSTPTPQPEVVSSPDAPWSSAEVQKMTISENTPNYTIEAQYPKTNSDSVTLALKSFVEEQISQFKDDTSWVGSVESASSSSLSLEVTYESVKSATVQNYIFSINSYTGGAHGMQVRRTFNYDKNGQLLAVSSLFSNGISGLSTFAGLVQKELQKREGADQKWIADGAGAKEENYSSFIVLDKGVTVLFDPYQVSAYSDGSIDITIPINAFSKIANPEVFRP